MEKYRNFDNMALTEQKTWCIFFFLSGFSRWVDTIEENCQKTKGVITMKRIISILLAIAIACVSVVALADTGRHSKTVYANNKKISLSNNYNWVSNASNGWVWGDAVLDYSGYASCKSPSRVSNMVLTNIIHCDKILGGFTASASGGTSGASGSVGVSVSSNSTSATFSYSISNKSQINVNFNYQARCGGIWLHCKFMFETTSVVQSGSNFYQMTTGAY